MSCSDMVFLTPNLLFVVEDNIISGEYLGKNSNNCCLSRERHLLRNAQQNSFISELEVLEEQCIKEFIKVRNAGLRVNTASGPVMKTSWLEDALPV